MENNNEVLLKVDHLCQYFRMGRKDLKAVDDVSFEIKKGEAFGLVGESGCGKTTTGRSIIKLYDITSGDVYFKGEKISAGTRSYKDAISKARSTAKEKIKELRAEKNVSSERAAEIDKEIEKINSELRTVIAENRKKIRSAKVDCKEVDKRYSKARVEALHAEYAEKLRAAGDDHAAKKALEKEYKQKCRVAKKSKLITEIQMIFQDPYSSLSPRLPVGEIIGEAVKAHHLVDKANYKDYILDVMKKCGLQTHYYERYPHEFSGGQRQRICIARALALQPKLVVCDEPVSALDVSIQAQIINLLKDLQDELNLTYVFISHDLSVVEHISDEIGVMYLGSMVESGDKNKIYANPMHPYTQALLSAVPVPDPNVKMNRIILKGDIPSPANPPKGCKFHTRCHKCMDICKKVAPKFNEYEPNHFCACHLYDQGVMESK